jgi:hypothetical protein
VTSAVSTLGRRECVRAEVEIWVDLGFEVLAGGGVRPGPRVLEMKLFCLAGEGGPVFAAGVGSVMDGGQRRLICGAEVAEGERPALFEGADGGGLASAEVIRGLVPRRYSLILGRWSPIAGIEAAAASSRPSAAPRCWLMSASMATTCAPAAARCRMNSEDSVVFPLPPLPANAIFTLSP